MKAAPRRGATLVELLVVLTILSVLATVVSPWLQVPEPVTTSTSRAVALRTSAVRLRQTLTDSVAVAGTATVLRAEPSGTIVRDSAGALSIAFSADSR